MGWRNHCLLCKIELEPIEGSTGLQAHPEVEWCGVRLTDSFGVALDPQVLADALAEHGDSERPQPLPLEDGEIEIDLFRPAEEVLDDFFTQQGLHRLGGASSGRGWTSVGLFQRCPYAWKLRHFSVPQQRTFLKLHDPNLDIGTLVHVFLGLMYTQGIADSPYASIDLQALHDYLIANGASPENVAESWRLFQAYRLYYQYDTWQPMAVEYDLRDPRTGESCRFDLIAFLPEERGALLPGTYALEHKTAQRFDRPTLDGWSNDGEVIGQAMLWKRLGLNFKFGPLRGVIVNIIGKQKEPKFHRTHVHPSSLLIESHEDDLRRWEGLIQLAKSSQSFPRARNNCINRWGMCKHWDHCATEET